MENYFKYCYCGMIDAGDVEQSSFVKKYVVKYIRDETLSTRRIAPLPLSDVFKRSIIGLLCPSSRSPRNLSERKRGNVVVLFQHFHTLNI